MRMDDVVAAVRLALADPVDFCHHGVQQCREFFLGQLPPRAGHDVVDADAGPRMFDGGLAGCGGAREDLHLHAGLGEGRGQRADVDVHSAGVAGAGLFHRRGVEGQKGHTADQRHPGPPHDHSNINFALQKTLLLPLSPKPGKLRYVDKTASVAAVSQEQSFDIRKATPEDWPGMWSILQPVIREGETFTWDRDTSEQAARTKWMKEAPGQTFVAVRQDTGEILGTGEFHANQGGRRKPRCQRRLHGGGQQLGPRHRQGPLRLLTERSEGGRFPFHAVQRRGGEQRACRVVVAVHGLQDSGHGS